MPGSRINDSILDCAVYLYPTSEAARDGLSAGGSGFVVGVKHKTLENTWFLYVVTCRHVIEDGHSVVIRLNDASGSVKIIETEMTDWIYHSTDDIAVTDLEIDFSSIKFGFVPVDMFITPEQITEHNIGVGSEAFMIGRFVNHEGRQRNIPAARFGNISVMPIEPIRRHDGKLQESFAIEMRSVSGFSGSPVFTQVTPFDPIIPKEDFGKKWINIEDMYHIFFLGIDWGHIPNRYYVFFKNADGTSSRSSNYVDVSTNTAGVVPAWKLMELLQSDSLKLRRDAEEQKIENTKK